MHEAVREDLEQRMERILAAPARTISAQEVARDRAVVSECRYLMRLLSTRRRSEGEMRERLREREVPAEVAHEVMARIGRAGLIDDAAFAAEWVAQRQSLRGLSHEALRLELRTRGVDAETIAAAIGEHGSDEEELCRELARERLRREGAALEHADGPARIRISRRTEGFLRRRGHDGGLVRRVVASEMRAAAGR